MPSGFVVEMVLADDRLVLSSCLSTFSFEVDVVFAAAAAAAVRLARRFVAFVVEKSVAIELLSGSAPLDVMSALVEPA